MSLFGRAQRGPYGVASIPPKAVKPVTKSPSSSAPNAAGHKRHDYRLQCLSGPADQGLCALWQGAGASRGEAAREIHGRVPFRRVLKQLWLHTPHTSHGSLSEGLGQCESLRARGRQHQLAKCLPAVQAARPAGSMAVDLLRCCRLAVICPPAVQRTGGEHTCASGRVHARCLGPQLASHWPRRHETKAAAHTQQDAPFSLASSLFCAPPPLKNSPAPGGATHPARAAEKF